MAVWRRRWQPAAWAAGIPRIPAVGRFLESARIPETCAYQWAAALRTCWPITRRTTRGAAPAAAGTRAPPLLPLVLGGLGGSRLADVRPLNLWGSAGASMLRGSKCGDANC